MTLARKLWKASSKLYLTGMKTLAIYALALIPAIFMLVAILTPALKYAYIFARHYWNWLP